MSITRADRPRLIPRKSSNGPWNKMALVMGAATYLLVMYRLQTYTERNHMPGQTYALFAAILFLLGFALGLAASAFPSRAVTFLILGVFVAHSIIIWVDLREDPTNHNLLPFVFITYLILCSPAYLGAWLCRLGKLPRR